ncbi:hypothetical protein ACFPT5_15145 [Ornithinimicrobium kibberense]
MREVGQPRRAEDEGQADRGQGQHEPEVEPVDEPLDELVQEAGGLPFPLAEEEVGRLEELRAVADRQRVVTGDGHPLGQRLLVDEHLVGVGRGNPDPGLPAVAGHGLRLEPATAEHDAGPLDRLVVVADVDGHDVVVLVDPHLRGVRPPLCQRGDGREGDEQHREQHAQQVPGPAGARALRG